MGFLDTIASFIPFSGTADAEAPSKDEVDDSEVTKDDSTEEEATEESKDEGGEEEEEEEEEEEDEVVDPAEALRERESALSKQETTLTLCRMHRVERMPSREAPLR
jgi:hypothetical protein